jgi:hypothetical protein
LLEAGNPGVSVALQQFGDISNPLLRNKCDLQINSRTDSAKLSMFLQL